MNWRSQELSDDRSGLKSNSDFLARASHVLAAKIYADSNAKIVEKNLSHSGNPFLFFVFPKVARLALPMRFVYRLK